MANEWMPVEKVERQIIVYSNLIYCSQYIETDRASTSEQNKAYNEFSEKNMQLQLSRVVGICIRIWNSGTGVDRLGLL